MNHGYKISQEALDAAERIANPPKTPFTHEGLLERGFDKVSLPPNPYDGNDTHRDIFEYRKDLGAWDCVIELDTPQCYLYAGVAQGTVDTTITTIEDLDIMLGFLKQ